MFFIKACPSCSRKIRFPIDKGTILVKCTCGYSFTADPDNPDTFKNGTFDLAKGKLKSKWRNTLKNRIKAAKIKEINLKSIINGLLDYRYKISNFKLLPAKEQRKIILMILSLLFMIGSLIYVII